MYAWCKHYTSTAAEAFEALPDSRAASPCSSPYGAGNYVLCWS